MEGEVNGSDLAFLEELTYKGTRSFTFVSFDKEETTKPDTVVRFEQDPKPKDTSRVVWPSAIRLANLIYTQREDILKAIGVEKFEQVKVIELGCGVFPLVSVACSLLGMDVTSTDLKEVIENIADTRAITIRCAPLEWESDADFSNIGDSDKFNLIVGADIIYNELLHSALIQTIQKLLHSSASGAFVLFSWQLRNREIEEHFFKALTDARMSVIFIKRSSRERIGGLLEISEAHFKHTRIARIMLEMT